MAHRTLTELLEEANLVSKYPNAEQLRDRVTDYLIQVYKKVAVEALYYPGVLVIEPTRYQSVDLPKTLIKIINIQHGDLINESDFVTRQINRFGQFVTGRPFTRAKEQANKLWFLDNQLTEPITVTYWQIPVDNLGNPLVDDRLWQAAVYYSWAHLALIDFFNKNKQSYSGQPMSVTKAMADKEIDFVRGDCNELIPPDFVTLYESLAMVNNSYGSVLRIAY